MDILDQIFGRILTAGLPVLAILVPFAIAAYARKGQQHPPADPVGPRQANGRRIDNISP